MWNSKTETNPTCEDADRLQNPSTVDHGLPLLHLHPPPADRVRLHLDAGPTCWPASWGHCHLDWSGCAWTYPGTWLYSYATSILSYFFMGVTLSFLGVARKLSEKGVEYFQPLIRQKKQRVREMWAQVAKLINHILRINLELPVKSWHP